MGDRSSSQEIANVPGFSAKGSVWKSAGSRLVPKERSSRLEMFVPGMDSPLGQKLCGRHIHHILVDVDPALSHQAVLAPRRKLQENPSSQCGGKLRHSEIEFILDKTKLPIYREFGRGRAILAQGEWGREGELSVVLSPSRRAGSSGVPPSKEAG